MADRAHVLCALCRQDNQVEVAGVLPEPVDPPDFDTRPGEPLRSTLPLWIHSCWRCGYAADDIASAPAGMADIVDSETYRQWLLDETLPAKAREFLCYAVILERFRQLADAGWSALHAAWICDDDTADDAAARCRARAIELWYRGKQSGQLFCDDMASEFALVTDVYRRMGQFEHATVACAEGLDLDDIPPAIESMLRRQAVLIQQRDTSAHSMKELMAAPSPLPDY